MPSGNQQPLDLKTVIRFGVFELHLVSGELLKQGRTIRLQEQPLRVLALLLLSPGQVVTRDELRKELWPEDTFVEFDDSLNTAIRKIRQALGDSADTPRFVETLPRRGYRFIAPVESSTATGSQDTDLEGGQVAAYGGCPPALDQEPTSAFGSRDDGLRLGLAPQPRVTPPSSSKVLSSNQKHRKLQAVAVATGFSLLVLGVAYFRWTPPQVPEARLRKFRFAPPVAVGGGALCGSSLAMSPNGKHIAFTDSGETRSLWIWDLDQHQPRALEGTTGACSPFWSPDSDSVAFATGKELKKVSVHGGLAARVCDLPTSSCKGGTWSPGGDWIVFSSGDPLTLYEVSARGGTPKPLFLSEVASSGLPTVEKFSPHFLPAAAGSRVLVFASGTVDRTNLIVQDLETGERELLGPGSLPSYSTSGHIVYQQAPLSHNLWAVPFSLDTLKTSGEAFPIAADCREPTVATDGTLVYLDGAGQQRLVWCDRRGRKTAEIGLPVQSTTGGLDLELSPHGQIVAVAITENSNEDVWVYELTRPVRKRLTFSPELDYFPVFSPNGEQVAFASRRSRQGQGDIFLQGIVDGNGESGESKVMVATPQEDSPTDWSRDGKYVLYMVGVLLSQTYDIWYLESNPDGSGWEPHPFLQTPFNERGAKLSPDNRYVAYVSDESGQLEVYVRDFPEGRRQWVVSSHGGRKPRWSRNGNELFYVEGANTLVAVSVRTSPSFSVGSTTRLFEHPSLDGHSQYDVSADGQRFILAEQVGESRGPVIHVAQDWYEEFRNREQD